MLFQILKFIFSIWMSWISMKSKSNLFYDPNMSSGQIQNFKLDSCSQTPHKYYLTSLHNSNTLYMAVNVFEVWNHEPTPQNYDIIFHPLFLDKDPQDWTTIKKFQPPPSTTNSSSIMEGHTTILLSTYNFWNWVCQFDLSYYF